MFPLPLPDRINTSISHSLTHTVDSTALSSETELDFIYFLKNPVNDTLLEGNTKIFSFYRRRVFVSISGAPELLETLYTFL